MIIINEYTPLLFKMEDRSAELEIATKSILSREGLEVSSEEESLLAPLLITLEVSESLDRD